MGQKNGLHAFGYNTSESEPIWRNLEKLWAKCRGLALSDFGRDPRSSDSLRGSRSCVSCHENNARFHRFPVGQIFTTFEIWHLTFDVDRWGGENFRNRILKISPQWVVFKKKRKKCSQNFQVLRPQAVIIPQCLQMPKTHGQVVPGSKTVEGRIYVYVYYYCVYSLIGICNWKTWNLLCELLCERVLSFFRPVGATRCTLNLSRQISSHQCKRQGVRPPKWKNIQIS